MRLYDNPGKPPGLLALSDYLNEFMMLKTPWGNAKKYVTSYSKEFGSTGRRQRHRSSQMKFFASKKFANQASAKAWSFANGQAIKYRANGLFGLN